MTRGPSKAWLSTDISKINAIDRISEPKCRIGWALNDEQRTPVADSLTDLTSEGPKVRINVNRKGNHHF